MVTISGIIVGDSVTPLAGVGIEITCRWMSGGIGSVTPLAGVGIEIFCDIYVQDIATRSPPSRGWELKLNP